MKRASILSAGLIVLGFGFAGGCGDDDENASDRDQERVRPDETGAACQVADECFPEVADRTMITGEIRCLARIREGYCTHTCDTDEDCCAVEGECDPDLNVVCSPFESEGVKMCFISCEAGDLTPPPDGGPTDEAEFCQREASADFICRSSGGGSENRKICVPDACGVGASCAEDIDCDGDLACNLDFRGGYCGARGCAIDADCPPDSACVETEGGNVCLKLCLADTDCSLCRGGDFVADCTDQVTFIEATGVTVCAPERN